MENQKQIQKQNDHVHVKNAQQLRAMMETQGWKTIVKPLVDKMIADVVGYRQENGIWNSGSFGDKRISNAKAENLLWYREGLINFNNHLMTYFSIAEGARRRLRAKKNNDYKIPLLDSSYSNVGQDEVDEGGAISE